MDWKKVFIICNDALCGFTLITVSVIGLYLIYLNWNATFIIKRERVLHLQFLLSLFLTEMSILLGSVSATFFGYDSRIFIISRMIVMVGFTLIIFNIFTIRWLLYFNNNWTLATMKSKWEYIIIGNHKEKHQTNWFIRNKHKYGQYRKIRKYIIVVCGVYCIWTCISYYLDYKKIISAWLYSIIFLSLKCVVSLLLATLVYKTPKYMDEFYIAKESRWHLILIALLLGCHTSWVILQTIIPKEHEKLLLSIFAAIDNYIWNSIFMVSTFVIVYKNRITKSSNIDSNDISLEDMLQNEDRMQLFINHLYKEYNIELITSYIEINYLLNRFIALNDALNMGNKYIETFYHELSSVIIKKDQNVSENYSDSDRSTNNNKSALKMHANIIYTKYIKNGSEFEINISGPLKNRFDSIINNNEFDINNNSNYIELFDTFYAIKKEMHKMMSSSFDRFKTTDDYRKMYHITK